MFILLFQCSHCIFCTLSNLCMIKMQQLSLKNDVIRKMLGLPDIGAHSGNASPKSLLEGQKMMQVKLSEVFNVVAIGYSYNVHYVQLQSC